MTQTWIEAARTKIRDVLSAEPAAVPVRLVAVPAATGNLLRSHGERGAAPDRCEECLGRLKLIGSDAADELQECLARPKRDA